RKPARPAPGPTPVPAPPAAVPVPIGGTPIPAPIRNPVGFAAGGGTLWFVNHDPAPDGHLYKANPATGDLLASFDLPLETVSHPWSTAFDGERVWVAGMTSELAALDPKTGRLLKTLRLPEATRPDAPASATGFDPEFPYSITDLAADSGSLWVLARQKAGAGILRIDPSDGRTLSFVPAPEDSTWLAQADGSLWVRTRQRNAEGVIVRLDPLSGRVLETRSLPDEARFLSGLESDGSGGFLVTDNRTRRVVRLEPKRP
ncbi:MAG: PQQ-binding-like beta-propeller repeat protein, partial [Planctomycetota bacterium]